MNLSILANYNYIQIVSICANDRITILYGYIAKMVG